MKTILLLAAATSLFGQIAPGMKLAGHVPFAFRQGNVTMPAGRYELKVASKGMVVVANSQTRLSVVSAFRSRAGEPSKKGYLAFRCYGESNTCFLREIAAPSNARLIAIVPSKVEKEFERSEGPSRVTFVAAERFTPAGE